MDLPTVSVIVPHLNQPEALAACLASLDAQTLDGGRFEIFVVDNGSTDATACRVSFSVRPSPPPRSKR